MFLADDLKTTFIFCKEHWGKKCQRTIGFFMTNRSNHEDETQSTSNPFPSETVPDVSSQSESETAGLGSGREEV